MTAAYPTSLLSWTQRVNGATVWAADPNTLAAEIDAVEQFVGLNPQNESQALTGGTKTFASMSARVSDAMLQRGHPYIQLSRTTNWNVFHTTSALHTTQAPFGTVNSAWPGYSVIGGAVTIKDTGVWLINVTQRWQYASSGWVMTDIYLGGNIAERNIFSYDQFPASGSNAYGERFLNLDGYTNATVMTRINAGTVVSVGSGNFTNLNPLQVHSMAMSLYYLRP